MTAKIIFIFCIVICCNAAFGQNNFKDFAQCSNSNIIMYYFNSELFLPYWPVAWSEANGNILINSKSSKYKTRSCTKANDHLFIDSTEYLHLAGKEYQAIRKTKIDVDFKDKKFTRSDVATFGDSLGVCTLKYDNQGRLNYISYKLFPGWIMNDMHAHHYQLYYSESDAMLDSIVGMDVNGNAFERRVFSRVMNFKDSILYVNDQDNFKIFQMDKSGDTLKTSIYLQEGKGIITVCSEFFKSGGSNMEVYSYISPVHNYKKQILYQQAITIKNNQTVIEKVNYENFPIETSRNKTIITLGSASSGMVKYQFYADNKLDLEIEEK